MFRGFICFYIRDLLQGPWRVYKNGSGRIFYHNTELQRSSWKPPRKYKPLKTREMREAIARDIEDQEVLIPDGFEEFYDKNSGIKKYTS